MPTSKRTTNWFRWTSRAMEGFGPAMDTSFRVGTYSVLCAVNCVCVFYWWKQMLLDIGVGHVAVGGTWLDDDGVWHKLAPICLLVLGALAKYCPASATVCNWRLWLWWWVIVGVTIRYALWCEAHVLWLNQILWSYVAVTCRLTVLNEMTSIIDSHLIWICAW